MPEKTAFSIPLPDSLDLPKSVTEVLEQYSLTDPLLTLNFGKKLLIQSQSLIEYALSIDEQYQPFNLTPEINELLHALEKIPDYFAWYRRFFYQLPIIGVYFSPLRHLEAIRQEIILKLNSLSKLLTVQTTLIQKKITALSTLSLQNDQLLTIHKFYQQAGANLLDQFSRVPLYEQTLNISSLKSKLSTLNMSLTSLELYAYQSDRSLKTLKKYLAEINFVNQSLFPLWYKQLQLIHKIVLQRAKIRFTPNKNPHQLRARSDKKVDISQIKSQIIENYQQDIFDLESLNTIQQETIQALKSLL